MIRILKLESSRFTNEKVEDTMATATKKTPAKAAAKAPAKATKQAPAVEVNEGSEIQEGDEVRFLGYAEDTPDDQKTLTEGKIYPVVGFLEPDPENDEPGGDPIVRIPNPSFDPKKKEHPEKNAKTIDVQVFADEVEVVTSEEQGEPEQEEDGTEEGTEEDLPEEDEEEAPPAAKKGKAKTEAKAAGKTKTAPAKAETKAAAKKVAAKGKAAKGKDSTKGKTKDKAKAKAETDEEKDEVPELENEDADVLAIVEGTDNLIEAAQDLDDKVAQNEYTIGGLLYHIKKDKLHHEILGEDEKPLYAGKGGWAEFLVDHFKMEYRKAQWLLEIYVHFTIAGIENPAEIVAQIGYTKAKTIAKELTKDDANIDDLIELAQNNSAADLSIAIKSSEHVGGTKGEKKSKMTLRFRFYEDEAKTMDQILKAAAEQFGVDDIGQAMLQIATEWADEHGGGKPTKEAAPAQRASTGNGTGGTTNGKATSTPKKAAAKRAAVAA